MNKLELDLFPQVLCYLFFRNPNKPLKTFENGKYLRYSVYDQTHLQQHQKLHIEKEKSIQRRFNQCKKPAYIN